ncbi:HORMA domain-containing protein 1, partial [Cichlidogyrus casuarinus]
VKQIAFVLYPKGKDIDAAVEVYIFNFAYNCDDIILSLNQMNLSNGTNSTFSFDEHNSECWKDEIVAALNAIKTTETTLKPLPRDLMFTMKINFIEYLPEDFVLPGFTDCDAERRIKFEREKSNIRLGPPIKTKFHSVKILMQTEAGMVDRESNNEPVPQIDSGNCSPIDEEQEGSKERANKQELVINCPCGSEEEDFLMVTCAECGYLQHGPCFNFFKHNAILQKRFCTECADVMHSFILIRFS